MPSDGKESERDIEARQLTKRYGDKLAVNGLTFTVHPGVVTGFLGPDGAGKSTTMRMVLGLAAPTTWTPVSARPACCARARQCAVPHRGGPARPRPGCVAAHHCRRISALFGLLFAPQLVLGLLPESVSDAAYRYLPTPAGAAVSAIHRDPLALAPWTGLGLFCLSTAITLGLAAWQVRRRDV